MSYQLQGIDPTPQSKVKAPVAFRPLVLIVDDDEDARAICAEVLQARGFRSAGAKDGETAIEMTIALSPDVILMDGAMPGMSGFETAQRLKRDVRTTAIPIVMLTGFTRSAGESSCDYDAYLPKPSTADAIAVTLRTALPVRFVLRSET